MSDRAAGKWLPYGIEDGNLHECKVKKDGNKIGTKKAEEPKPQLKNILEAQLFLERIDARVRKLESILLGPRK